MLGPGTIMSDEELDGTSSDESEPEDMTGAAGAAFTAAARKKSAAAAAAASAPTVGNRFDYEELDDGFAASVFAAAVEPHAHCEQQQEQQQGQQRLRVGS